MFNVGSEDKKKLRENMEEIKNLIQNRDDDSEQPKVAEKTSPNTVEENGIAESSLDSPPLNQSSEDEGFQADNSQDDLQLDEPKNADNFGDDDNLQGNTSNDLQLDENKKNFSSGSKESENNFETASNQPTQNLNNSNTQNQFSQKEKQEEFKAGTTTSKAPERSQKLFLEVERFEKVKDMIDEMQKLTQDIETTSQDLEDQIDDERESENVAQQLLDNFEDRKREVEGIVLDSEEN